MSKRSRGWLVLAPSDSGGLGPQEQLGLAREARNSGSKRQQLLQGAAEVPPSGEGGKVLWEVVQEVSHQEGPRGGAARGPDYREKL